MRDVNFTNSVFDQVEFMGYDLSAVTLPQDPDITLIPRYKCVVEHALSNLDGDESPEARMLRGEFTNRLKMMKGPDGASNVFNRRDYLMSGGEPLAKLAEQTFHNAQKSCE